MSISLKVKNYAESTLAQGLSISSTQLVVASGEGSKFPSTGPFRAVIWTAAFSSPSSDPAREIVTMQLVSGDTFSITRGQEGTSAGNWSPGDHVAHVLTAGKIEEIENEILSRTNGRVPYKISGGLADSPIYTDGTSVSIGKTVDPIFALDIQGHIRSNAGNFYLDNNRDCRWGDSTTYIRGAGMGASSYISLVTNYIQGLYQDSGGSIGIGTTTPGGSTTVGTKVLSIANGTEPVGGRDGQISLFSKDVSNSAELFVMDEAGNKTQLSPHPTDFLDTLPIADRPFPWAYRSENEYLGKRISVDLAGLVAAVEQLTGKKFMFIEDIPQRSWDADQEAQRLAREKEIQNALQQVAELEQKIVAEENEDKKQELVKQKEAIVIPEPYVKREPPKWIADRLKQTQMSRV